MKSILITELLDYLSFEVSASEKSGYFAEKMKVFKLSLLVLLLGLLLAQARPDKDHDNDHDDDDDDDNRSDKRRKCSSFFKLGQTGHFLFIIILFT